jgi:hypothetical protein
MAKKIVLSNSHCPGAYASEVRVIEGQTLTRNLYFREDPEPYHKEEIPFSSGTEALARSLQAGFRIV